MVHIERLEDYGVRVGSRVVGACCGVDGPRRCARQPSASMGAPHPVGRSRPARRVDERRGIRRAVRAAGAVRHAAVPHRRGIREAAGRRAATRRARLRASTCSPARSTRRTRRFRTGASTRHDSRRTSLVIDPPNGRLPPRTPAPRRSRSSGAAACNAASRATRTRTTGSACAASSTAAAFPTRCSRRSTTPTCGSCRLRVSSRSPTS